MKKSVVIIIGVIYGLSIVLVTLFGLRAQTFNEIVYVSQIEVIEELASFRSDGSKYIILTPDEEGKRDYQINWKVSPDNATNTAVTFDYDKTKTNVSVDENGLVSFSAPGSVTVTVTAKDGTSKSDSILIIFSK